MATSGEKRWPPVGNFVAASGEKPMAIDIWRSQLPHRPEAAEADLWGHRALASRRGCFTNQRHWCKATTAWRAARNGRVRRAPEGLRGIRAIDLSRRGSVLLALDHKQFPVRHLWETASVRCGSHSRPELGARVLKRSSSPGVSRPTPSRLAPTPAGVAVRRRCNRPVPRRRETKAVVHSCAHRRSLLGDSERPAVWALARAFVEKRKPASAVPALWRC